ncbi:hypothetical protein [Plantactinospora sp. WMMB782]|uniref:hypothetical protein n=1 Tax=Plantactinospora sp. WMMB782 TaxID=3404121 RepID=UPI003B9469A7
MALASKSAVGGDLPPFFKPENYAGDLAIIFEPKTWREGKSKFKDPKTDQPRVTQNVNTQVTVFRNQAALDDGKPSSVDTFTINATCLARDLVKLLDEAKQSGDPAPALIAVLKKVPTQGNDTWVFRLPADEHYEAAAAYYEKREADIAAAMDDAPSFD